MSALKRGHEPPTIEASSYYGSFGSWRYGLKATGALGDGTQRGDVDYTVSTTRFTTHGYRDRSSAQKSGPMPNWACAWTIRAN